MLDKEMKLQEDKKRMQDYEKLGERDQLLRDQEMRKLQEDQLREADK